VFTGIIETKVSADTEPESEGFLRYKLDVSDLGWDLRVGQSIAVNGICLTVESVKGDPKGKAESFSVCVMPETLRVSVLDIKKDLNLERALLVSSRYEGHMVQGHVDTVGEVINVLGQGGDDYGLQFKVPVSFANLVISKGSIAINGVSLTVVNPQVQGDDLLVEVWLIPHTLEHTNLGQLEIGDSVNIEFDILGKYLANTLKYGDN